MNNVTLARSMGWITLVAIVLGLVAGFTGGPLLGISAVQFFTGGIGFALLAYAYLIIDPPPRPPPPPCPPFCREILWVGLIFFAFTLISELLLGGSIGSVTTLQLFLAFIALTLLGLGGATYGHIMDREGRMDG